MSAPVPLRQRLATVPRTLGALALLQATLPVDLAVVLAVDLRHRVAAATRPPAEPPAGPRRTVLLSGGKMTKALALARSFSAAGHRVVLVESARYRLTAHRFSRAVDAFHVVPDAAAPGYVDAMVDVVRREGVDVYVPVCSPASSRYDALAKPVLEQWCEVLHGDADDVDRVDDKARFAQTAVDLGLAVPDTHRVGSAQEVEDFDFAAHDAAYVLKSIPYDPVARLDLRRLPRPTPAATAALARSKGIGPERPFVLQEFVEGQEYCTHGTVREGRLQVWACCESSASQLNYAHVEKPEVEAWVRRFVGELGLTGQYSFDFLERPDGRLVALECNPRTHSAITMFYDHPGLASAYLDTGAPPVRPTSTSRPTYWTYHELWRLLRQPRDVRRRVAVLRAGTDAVLDPADPWPFFLLHHLHVPSLLLLALVRLRPWVKVDLNIGKLVEPGGD